jgi:EmrB/QacA subfamily drug resistance transporter
VSTVTSQKPAGSLVSPIAAKDDRARWFALVVLCVGMLMIILDLTVVNVALPTIQDDLHFSQSGLAWVVNAYLISLGGLLLLAGRLGDLLGRRRIFLSGLVLFTLASVVCGAAASQGVLVAARLVQGIGGALTSSVILGMIVTMFPEPRERAKAIGVFSFVASAGGSIGLLAGGVLTTAINWHWIFFINVPIGAATLLFTLRTIPNDRGIGFGAGADILGATLITSSLMLGVYTIVTVPGHGWGATRTLLFGAGSLVLMALFVVRQLRIVNPLMPLGMLRSRNVAGANGVQVLMAAGLLAVFFLGPLYLGRVLGMNAIDIGFAFLPATVGISLFSLGFYERLATRFGARSTLAGGLGSITVALILLARLPVHGHYFSDVLPPMVLIGIGGGLAWPQAPAGSRASRVAAGECRHHRACRSELSVSASYA